MTTFKETIEYIDLTRAKSEASVYLLLKIKAKIILNLSTQSHDKEVKEIQSNLFNTDTKGTEPSVRFTEVSVL